MHETATYLLTILKSWLLLAGIALAFTGAFFPSYASELEQKLDAWAERLLPSRLRTRYIRDARAACALALVLLCVCATTHLLWPDQAPFAPAPLEDAWTLGWLKFAALLFLAFAASAVLLSLVSFGKLLGFFVSTIVGYLLAAGSFLSGGRPLQAIGAVLAVFDVLDELLNGNWVYRTAFLLGLAAIILITGRAARRSQRPQSRISPLAEAKVAGGVLAMSVVASGIIVVALAIAVNSGWSTLFLHNTEIGWGPPLASPIATSNGLVITDVLFGAPRFKGLIQPTLEATETIDPTKYLGIPTFAVRFKPVKAVVEMRITVSQTNNDGKQVVLLKIDQGYDGSSGVIVSHAALSTYPETRDIRNGVLDFALSTAGSLIATRRMTLKSDTTPIPRGALPAP